ncbi:ATP-grasp domain-containing protein [Burkholderia gladioli]|uniref:ATP-grasp domain-containing protein n=1 Tax=Burkholderia gladioli TaxID=28095 RepID=UPI00163E34C8|nr:ATP-grasp domain-containing protein [Burkholderia gladioli]
MSHFSILRQAGTSHMEEKVVLQYALMTDVPIQSTRIESIVSAADSLRAGTTLPVGTVEFVRAAMELAGIEEPANLSYPEVLRPWLYRKLEKRAAGSVLGHYFIKPTATKRFTGFVFDTLSNPEHLSFHDRAQYNAFLSMPADEKVWVSEPVTWLSEFRYYVLDGKVLGNGRYDDGPDDAPEPDEDAVGQMAQLMAREPDAPAAFSIDVGVLDTGETALIECNDAWALGYYKGTLSHRDYVAMLWRRWEQLGQVQRA